MSTTGAERLAAEFAVRDLIVSAWAAIDRKDWDTYAAAFALDGEFEILGQRRRGRADIAAGPSRDLEKYDGLQHLISNISVRLNGDEATGQWYRFTARRDADGWHFAEVVIRPVWSSGIGFEIEDAPES